MKTDRHGRYMEQGICQTNSLDILAVNYCKKVLYGLNWEFKTLNDEIIWKSDRIPTNRLNRYRTAPVPAVGIVRESS